MDGWKEEGGWMNGWVGRKWINGWVEGGRRMDE